MISTHLWPTHTGGLTCVALVDSSAGLCHIPIKFILSWSQVTSWWFLINATQQYRYCTAEAVLPISLKHLSIIGLTGVPHDIQPQITTFIPKLLSREGAESGVKLRGRTGGSDHLHSDSHAPRRSKILCVIYSIKFWGLCAVWKAQLYKQRWQLPLPLGQNRRWTKDRI